MVAQFGTRCQQQDSFAFPSEVTFKVSLQPAHLKVYVAQLLLYDNDLEGMGAAVLVEVYEAAHVAGVLLGHALDSPSKDTPRIGVVYGIA